MDRALIERMVGAVVLVLLLVVVAPALLDGSLESDSVNPESAADGGTRTEVIILNGRPDGRNVPPPIVMDQAIELPEERASRKNQPEPAPVVAANSPPRKEPSRNPEGYAVQIGSFASKDNADQFAAGLSGEGFAVFVMSAKTAKGNVYRVNAGPRATRSAAEKLAAEIGKSGRSVMVIELGSATNGGSQ